MAIVFMGGEIGAFIPADSASGEATTAGYFDSNFARCALYCHSTTSYCEGVPTANITDGWLHFDARLDASAPASGSTVFPLLIWYDGSGTARVRITHRLDSNSFFTLQYDVGAGWVTAGSAFALDFRASRQTIDIHPVVNSATGSLKLYVAGTLRVDSGTIDLSAITALGKFRFFGTTISVLNFPSFISQVIASSSASTIGMRLMTMYPSGAGATDQWTGAYTTVDEALYSDADFIYSDTADQVEVFAGTLVGSMTGYTIVSVGVTARANTDGTGPENLRLAVRTASTNYFSGSDLALDAGYGAYIGIWETNPNTTLTWAVADASAIQFGVKSIA